VLDRSITLNRLIASNLIRTDPYKIAYTTLIPPRISNPIIARSNIQRIVSTTPVPPRIALLVERELPILLNLPLSSNAQFRRTSRFQQN